MVVVCFSFLIRYLSHQQRTNNVFDSRSRRTGWGRSSSAGRLLPPRLHRLRELFEEQPIVRLLQTLADGYCSIAGSLGGKRGLLVNRCAGISSLLRGFGS